MQNRSMPSGKVIPVLQYPDVEAAVLWLQASFGFEVRLKIGSHRAQLTYEGGALVLAQGSATPSGHSIMVRVADALAHYDRAVSHGAKVTSPPTDYPYGERQYTATDIAGHVWTFSQTITDTDPADWGGLPQNG